MTQLTITEARRALPDLPERLAKAPDKAVSITRRGRPVLALLPWELYESIIATLNVLADHETTAALQSSLEDIRRGRVMSHETARRRLLRQRLLDR
jgi:PHD/YefM family antitoxin component YafN of YafNO toxin-antitoxin module